VKTSIFPGCFLCGRRPPAAAHTPQLEYEIYVASTHVATECGWFERESVEILPEIGLAEALIVSGGLVRGNAGGVSEPSGSLRPCRGTSVVHCRPGSANRASPGLLSRITSDGQEDPARKGPARKTAAKSTKKQVKRAVPKKPAASVKRSAAPKEPKTVRRKKPESPESQLQSLDRDIVKLVNRRAELTVQHLQSQPDVRKAMFDPHVEQELWARLESENKGPLSPAAMRSIFREVISSARSKLKTLRVAYLGPAFSFTHLAAIERFGKSADLIPVNTIASVFEEVNRGHAHFGMVPIENSTDGRVVDTLDMFTRLPLRICGEVQMAIHHNLLSRSPRSEIVEIYSKPQALSQCRDWLARNMPRASTIEVTSTSTAAQLARDKPGAAAVASRQAAVQYDLEIVAEKIEDNAYNVTRFAVIGEEETKPTGRDRTALLLQIPHTPGSLSDALTAFKNNKTNLTWIESFPLRGPESGYLFFLDFEGHQRDPKVQKALEALQKKAVRMEVLGSYPRCEPLE
jgi:chorismate mutase/prephenate dehydratase